MIRRGQVLYHRLWPQLWQIESRYGVDAATLLAIYGKETSYGLYTGNFDLLEVLASLAYEGRRRAMFEAEFLATLKLIQGGVPRSTLRGSYAGATGLPQFMPTVVLRLRADGDGDRIADIWTNQVDALASIANYFRDAGWKPGLPWGGIAHVPGNLNRTAIRNSSEEARCSAVFRRHSRALTIAEWQGQGVTVRAPVPATATAALIEPEGPSERPYLLTSNYRAILSYNCSNSYALSVALLSDAIARR
jgi:lytic murein transglycosylase